MNDRTLSADRPLDHRNDCPPDVDAGVIRWLAQPRGPWFALIWLPVLMLAPILTSAMAGDGITLVIHLAIAVWYVVTVVVSTSRLPEWAGELCVAGLTVLIVLQFVVSGGSQGFLYPLLAIAAATAIHLRAALGFVMGLSISGALAEGFATMSLGNALLFGFASVMAGASTYLIRYLTGVVGELRVTRRRLAAVAVAEERQRFARDLHDLLGHTLSVIVVKAEAVRRFAKTQPEVAVSHARGIEDIGRVALSDVRQAVAGYRELRLDDELSRAIGVLEDAGVSVEATSPLPRLDRPIDVLFAWVVREATTNVLRHAHADHCSVRVGGGSEHAEIEVTDNGRGARGAESGSGLRGLRERAERLGGTVRLRSDDHGFTLTVRVPKSTARVPTDSEHASSRTEYKSDRPEHLQRRSPGTPHEEGSP